MGGMEEQRLGFLTSEAALPWGEGKARDFPIAL